jgi:hypothetical protein
VDALIAQHPNDIGRIGAKMAVDYPKTNKKPAKKTVKTGLSVVTRNKVSEPKIPNIFTKHSVENSAPVTKRAGRLIRKALGDVCSKLDQLRALKLRRIYPRRSSHKWPPGGWSNNDRPGPCADIPSICAATVQQPE